MSRRLRQLYWRVRNVVLRVRVASWSVLGATAAFAMRNATAARSQQARLWWWITAIAISFMVIPLVEIVARRALAVLAARDLPERPHAFHGREGDIRALDAEFKRQGGWRRSRRSSRPVLLFIHGQPGVGKASVAAEYANRIERYYPTGVLCANLDNAGTAREPGEVLSEFLLKLREPGIFGMTTEEKLARFRTLTKQGRYLIILQGAHSADQVNDLLTAGPRCAVIITSGGRLSVNYDVRPHQVKVPSTSAAWEIFTTYAGDAASAHPEGVAEIVELCGRLPLALESAGVQVAHRVNAVTPPYTDSLSELVAALRPEPDRLRQLEYGALLLRRKIKAEYERLSDQERQALRRLVMVESDSFLPWVLAPLLGVSVRESGSIVGRLATAQLIEETGRDHPLGMLRYRFHPLTRIFAHEQLQQDETPADRAAARGAFDDEYLNEATEFLIRLDPALGQVLPRRSTLTLHGPAGAGGTGEPPRHWVRAEYGSLIRSVRIAHGRGEWALCWRIAAQLGDCVPLRLVHADAARAFDLALDAAARDGDESGAVEVLLAKGGFLIAIERYQQAFDVLRFARTRTEALSAAGRHPAAEAARLTAKRHREEGVAWLQLGSYRRAQREFESAKSAAVPDAAEARLIRVLIGETVSMMDARSWRDGAPYADGNDADDLTEYHLHLGRSEVARRKHDWAEAEAELYSALEPNYGDARRRANIEYRLARLCLTRAGSNRLPRRVRRESAERAVRHAATALLRFQKMGNPVGEVRARCLLARALTASGRCEDALPQSELALREIETLSTKGLAVEMVAPLTARAKRVRGQALLRHGDFRNAAPFLEAASGIFAALGDVWSQHDAMFLLGIAQHGLDRNDEALASLHASYSHFMRCGDTSYASGVVVGIAKAERRNGMRLASVEYRLKATRMRWTARRTRTGLKQLVTALELSE